LRKSFFIALTSIILLSPFRLAFAEDFKTSQIKNFNIYFKEDITAEELGTLKKILESAYEDMVKYLGDIVPKSTDVVIFGSCGDFTYHTKLPWWSASAMVDGTIYLQPILVLKERGILTNVVRHEVALVFIHHKWGEKAPMWFAEGLAVYYSDEIEILKGEIAGERPKIEGVEDIDSLLGDRDDRSKNRWGYIMAYEEVEKMMERDDWESLFLNP
jgi:hypothetical protein